MDVGVLRCWNCDPAPVNAALFGPQRDGKMTSGELLGAAGGKLPRTVDCGAPYQRPMSSSGQLVEMMMMMMNVSLYGVVELIEYPKLGAAGNEEPLVGSVVAVGRAADAATNTAGEGGRRLVARLYIARWLL
ncbi:jg27531 [Pararge aegeria aegeria]|uniref:Jg27531 protein n=1 Tax=Pararge aegeria aegeria TaxID=348720 RepID=A0A8S4SKX8_9NEOP|nr:jg27531 [Pararge aegeria aegeria]